MRALLLLLLVAGVFWWAPWKTGHADAGPEAAPIESMLAKPQGDTGKVEAQKPAETPPAAAPAQPLRLERTDARLPGIEDVLTRLATREAAAIDAGWLALARGAGPDARSLTDALRPAGDDFAAQLAALGSNNTFLHSEAGRAQAGKAAAAAFALPDPEATAAGSKLLNLMLMGRIQKQDTAARALVDDVYKNHRIRVDRWLCDPGNVAGARSYTVAKGDSLAAIAGRFRKKEGIKVEEGTLAILNRVHNPKALQVGQKLKIPQAPLRGVVEKRSFSLALYVGDDLLRLYWVGHGENDRTPVTTFTIGVKQPHPDWTAPNGQVYHYGQPENILGEYFIKFLNDTYVGFGAHGTPLPDTICTMSSAGCIRMYAPDIEELFKLIPMGAQIEVRATESVR